MTFNKNRKVEIVAYDPGWSSTFQDLQQVLRKALGELALTIEHVGSTSVPGLAAKPIIDVDVVIASREALPTVVRALAPLGYTHEGDLGISGREAFARADERVPYTPDARTWTNHHLYVCAEDNRELFRHLAFRDYLRTHPEKATAYEQLKRQLAVQFPNDVESYSKAKTSFVEDILHAYIAETTFS